MKFRRYKRKFNQQSPRSLKRKKVTQVSSPKETTITSFYVYIRIIPETVYAPTHIYPHIYKSTYIHIACT